MEATAFGKVLEWLKRHAWKACKPLKGFVGSNPILSAQQIPLSPVDTPFRLSTGFVFWKRP